MAMPSSRSRSNRWPHPVTGPWQIKTVWEHVDGQRECVGIEITPCPECTPTPLTATQLRTLKFGEVVEQHRRANNEALVENRAKAATISEFLPPDVLPMFDALIEDEAAPPKPRGRGRPVSLTAEHYARVAQVYRTAVPGQAPVQAVADDYNTSHGTAARWVGKARKLGLLPPTTPGKARGEN